MKKKKKVFIGLKVVFIRLILKNQKPINQNGYYQNRAFSFEFWFLVENYL